MFLQVLTVTMPAKFELKNVPLSPVNYSTQLNKLEPTSYAKKKKMLAYIINLVYLKCNQNGSGFRYPLFSWYQHK